MILVDLLAQAHLRRLHVRDPIAYLSSACLPRWQAVIGQHPARLRYVLDAALDYEQSGFLPSDWDNVRALAALAGVLRDRRIRTGSLRFEVARRYEQHITQDDQSPSSANERESARTRPAAAGRAR